MSVAGSVRTASPGAAGSVADGTAEGRPGGRALAACADRCGDAGASEVFAGCQRIVSLLVELRDLAEAHGGDVCLVYLEGAAEALRTGYATAVAEIDDDADADAQAMPDGVVALPSLGVALRPTGRGALAERGRMADVAGRTVFSPNAGAGEEPWPVSPDVGADLVASVRAREFARDPVSAALLADALAAHEWLHLASGETCAPSWGAAHALVRALAAGRFPPLPAGATRALVDVAVAELLRDLGWRRLQGPVL